MHVYFQQPKLDEVSVILNYYILCIGMPIENIKSYPPHKVNLSFFSFTFPRDLLHYSGLIFK